MAIANFKASLRELSQKEKSPLLGSTTLVPAYNSNHDANSVLKVLESFPVGLWYNFIEPD